LAVSSADTMPAETPDITEPLDMETGSATEDADTGNLPLLADDPTEAADETISLANAFLPSALGLSCLVKIPPRGLIVEISAATYRSRKVPYVTKKEED